MKRYTAESLGELVTPEVYDYIVKCRAARLSEGNAARLAGVSKVTYYKWKRDGIPNGSIPSYLLLNVLLAKRDVEAALEDGRLPTGKRAEQHAFVDSCLAD
jgi:hypothetical protein